MRRFRRRSGVRRSPKFLKGVVSLTKWFFKGLPVLTFSLLVVYGILSMRNMLEANSEFRVGRIEVFPKGLLSAEDLQLLERAALGKSLMRVDIQSISRKLERKPYVKTAQVNRKFPRELEVFVIPRRPFVTVRLEEQGPYFLVAEDGVILGQEEAANPKLARVEDYESKATRYPAGDIYKNRYFSDFKKFLEQAHSEPILSGEPISHFRIDRLGNWSVLLSDGTEIKIGRAYALSSEKRAVLKAILESQDRAQIASIDTRYGDVVVQKKSFAR